MVRGQDFDGFRGTVSSILKSPRRSLNILLTSDLSPTGFLSLFIGIFVSVLSVLLYIMVEEPMPTKIMMGLLFVYSFIPLIHYFS